MDGEGIVMRDGCGCFYGALGVIESQSATMVLGQTTRVHRDTIKALLEPRRRTHLATLAGTVLTRWEKKMYPQHGQGPGIGRQSGHFDCLSLCPRQFVVSLEDTTRRRAASGWRLVSQGWMRG
jgi:hypothetical protein